MLNIEIARKAVAELDDYASGSNGEDAANILREFINDVERLLLYNSNIKQVPALFKPPKKGS